MQLTVWTIYISERNIITMILLPWLFDSDDILAFKRYHSYTCIYVLRERDYRYYFKCNYLENRKHFSVFLLHFGISIKFATYWKRLSYWLQYSWLRKDTLKAFDDFKKSNKSVRSNAFWYLKVCISWKCIHYTMHWELQLITVLLLSCELIWAEAQGSSLTRVPKVPFRFFDKLKYEIRNKVLIFVSILKLRDET